MNPDKIHVIVCRELDNEDRCTVFDGPNLREDFLAYAQSVELWIGHNFLSFDLPHLNRLLPGINLDGDKCRDTLIISRLLNYGIEGGHSIEAWGNRLKCPKIGADITDWETYTPLMKQRCIQDTLVNLKLYKYFQRWIEKENWHASLETEHRLQYLCNEMAQEGFPFDVGRARALHERLIRLLEPLDIELRTAFPPKVVAVREVHPRLTKSGALNRNDFRFVKDGDLRPFTGGPFTILDYEEFNPGSVRQIVDRLNDAGWKPTDKTKGHKEAERDKNHPKLEHFRRYGWKVSEENLRTLPDTAPQAARQLAQRLLLNSRLSDLDEWLALVSPDNAIHGTFQGIGSWTQRMSHQRPNMANIPVSKRSPKDNELEVLINDINDDMRRLWTARPGYRLVGVDADGIQMRVFAHYVNDERLKNALISGNKENGSDIHSVHQRALGGNCRNRDDAKTFIYAWLLGAGIHKVADILRCSLSGAKAAVDAFISFYPGLAHLKKTQIPLDASRGYFEGLDGRYVVVPSEHKVLAGYLQNGEKIIMTRAFINWNKELRRMGIPFVLRNFIHDEWQTEVPDDDDIANEVARIQSFALAKQTEELGLRCPVIAGTPSFGYTWQETH